MKIYSAYTKFNAGLLLLLVPIVEVVGQGAPREKIVLEHKQQGPVFNAGLFLLLVPIVEVVGQGAPQEKIVLEHKQQGPVPLKGPQGQIKPIASKAKKRLNKYVEVSCGRCSKIVKMFRRCDLESHYAVKHVPDFKAYRCRVSGCKKAYAGARSARLHARKVHGLASSSEGSAYECLQENLIELRKIIKNECDIGVAKRVPGHSAGC